MIGVLFYCMVSSGGFDLSQTSGGMGLGNLRERAEDIGARLVITTAPGEGTDIRVTWDRPSDKNEDTLGN